MFRPLTPKERQQQQRLTNYKQLMADKAKRMGKSDRLRKCKTLTEAKKVMRGELD